MSIRLKDTIYDLVDKSIKDGSGNTITSTYLKLTGGTLTGDLILNAGNEDRFLKFQYNNGDTYGWRIGYLGSGSGDANYLVIQTSQETAATWTNALRLGNTKGDALFSASVTASGGFIGALTGNVTGNVSGSSGSCTGNAASATKLANARTLWGQSFDGTANVSGNMTGVGTISMSGALTLTGTSAGDSLISFSRPNYNYITFPTGYSLAFGTATGSASTLYRMTNDAFIPERTNEVSLGTSSLKWENVYATTFTGSLSGNATSSDHTTYIRITSTNPTAATTYNPIWAANSSATSDGTNDYTPRANNGFSYVTLEGTASALGYGIVRLGNSTASGTAGNKYGVLRLYSESSGYVNIRPGSASTSNYTLYLPGAGGQLVYHTNDTQIGAAAQPVYVTSGGEIAACSIGAGSGNSNRCLMVTNGSNGMYYTPTITGNYINGALISTVSDTTTVRHTCTNSNGSVSLYAATNRGLYDTTNSAWIIYLTTAADHVYVPKWASKGSTTAPVYFNSSGEPAQGSTYAGGTKVTLNGTAKGASTASFYAPTSAGTSGQYLISSGGAPTWLTIDPYDANISRTANTVLAAPNGSAGSATFRKLVAADIPTLAISKISGLQSALDGKSATGHTHSYLPLSGGTMNANSTITLPNSSLIVKQTSTTSNYVAGIVWYKGTTSSSTYDAQIGWHNTGDTSGGITILPYATTSSPWEKAVGLYISKSTFKWENNTILHSGNWSTYCAAASHTHSYASSSHNHDSVYSKLGHTHSYAASSHTHTKSQITDFAHTHDYAASSHTHSYAGSSSAGGAATSANKLNTNAGSSTQPVYFSGGVPVACSFPIVKYWAIYEIFWGNSGTTSSRVKQAGNFDFLGSVITHERVGQIYIYVNYPEGFSEKTTMIFGNGDHVGSTHTDVGYLTIGKQVYGLETDSGTNAGRLRLSLSDDASTNWGYAYLYFLCIS